MFDSISKLLNAPDKIIAYSFLYILLYYFVSFFFIHTAKSGKTKGIFRTSGVFKKNGILDYITTLCWFVVAVLIVTSLFNLSLVNLNFTLKNLICYYFLFIFLFAILYGLLSWHYDGMLIDLNQDNLWIAELQYLIVSIQTQSTLGYTKVRPGNVLMEIITSIQALMGIFFMAISVALAVNNLLSIKG